MPERRFFSRIVVLLLSVPQAFGQPVPTKPAIALSRTAHDFGAVREGVPVTHEFSITNRGTGELVIQKLTGSCGTTAFTAARNVVPPGESEPVRVTFDTTGFKGRRTESVRIFSNDSEQPSVLFSLTGTVVEEVQVEPGIIEFGEIPRSSLPLTKQLTVRTVDGSQVRIKAVTSTTKFIAVTGRQHGPGEWSGTVTLDSSTPVAPVRERLLISLEGAPSSHQTIPVAGEVKNLVELENPVVSFGIVEGGPILTREVRVINRSATPITSAEVKTAHAAVSGVYQSNGRGGTVRVSLDPAKMNKDLRSVLRIEYGDNQTLNLNVYAFTPPKR